MPDEFPIAYWDEMHAPLGLGREAAPARSHWRALLAAAAIVSMLAGFGVLGLPGSVLTHIARIGVDRQPPRGAQGLIARPPAPLAQDLGLRRTAAAEDSPPLAPPPAPPVEIATRSGPEPGAFQPAPTGLVINVAEALAAAKLKAARP